VFLSPSRFKAKEPDRDLNNEICLAMPADEPIETMRDLTKETFSTKPDVEPNEPPKYILRPLTKELTKLIEALKDLWNELFSKTVETEPIEALKPLAKPLASELTTLKVPVRVLKIEPCSPETETNPSEPVKDLTNPLDWEVEGDNEPANDLKSEMCSVKAGLIVHESVKDLEKDTFSPKLKIEDSDPPIDLKTELFSDKFDTEPIETDKYTVCPLKNELTKLTESVNDLK
jgi:hypothetical protein